ncbi:MAG: DUF4421 domain-containing protein [Muribaculaceae bacterium]|nr:DUF4421 domain-containing protein [Muribaculaceae bacterium]
MRCNAFSFQLDSIAAMGKFPRFCVNTYRWGDKFFNGYDTAYVVGTGYKFNGKIRMESWTDYYHPRFSNNTRMNMIADPTTSLGFYLNYLAVSVGYDINMGKLFGGKADGRKRWQFGFSCMLFSADLYFIRNDVGTTIRSIYVPEQPTQRVNIPFDGINTTEWGLNAYYFFNHKRYSQAAAFSFSRIQLKSQGSFFAGIAYTNQNFMFDFAKLPEEYIRDIPVTDYTLKTHNYAFQFGYGYNWVFHPKWNFGVTIAPMLGWTSGTIVEQADRGKSFAFLLRGKLGMVWNHKQWFASSIFSFQGNLVGTKEHALLTSYLTFELSAGYRFNIW